MERRTFEVLVEQVLESLPQQFAGQLNNLVFVVEDWADTELLAEAGFDDPAELLGFYSGNPLTERSFDQIEFGPDMIYLFRRAIEAEAQASGLPLRQVVRETLWHEIAHFFGFSEEEMERIEDYWAGQGED